MNDSIELTLWKNANAIQGKAESLPWATLPDVIREAAGQPNKESCPMIKLATFGSQRTAKGSLRHDENIRSITGIEGDYDGEVIPPAEAIARLEAHKVRAYVYTTWNHAPDKPRWRVLAPLSAPVTPEARQRYVEALNGVLGGVLARESMDVSRSYFIGTPPGVEPEILATFDDPADGYPLDQIDHLDELRLPFKGKAVDHEEEAQRESSGDLLHELLAGDDVHGNALRLVARWVYRGMEDAEIRQIMKTLSGEVAKARGEERAADLVGAELERMIAGARGKQYAPPPPVDLAFLSKRTTGRWLTPVGELLERPQPLEWLIKGFLLPGSLAMIVGDPEGGKSLLAIWWAACIAILRAWLGNRVKQGPVVYIAGEGHFGIRRRLKAWAIAHDCEDDLKRAPLFVSSSGTRFIDRKALDEVISEIDGVADEHGPPVLIVIDTLHRNLGGEENSADDMGIFFHHADAIRFRYGCTVLIVHHTGHGDKERGRGTSSIRAALDIEFLLSSNGTTRTLKPTKAKDMPRPAPLLFNLKEIELPWKDADGDHETSVILEAANGSAAMPETKASANIRLGVETLITVLDTTGRDEVTLEAWRQEFYARHPGDSHDSKKKAFQRARTDLVSNHVCDVRDDLYRLSDTATYCRWSDIVAMLLPRQIVKKPHGK